MSTSFVLPQQPGCELILLDDIMWQHTRRIVRLEKFEARLALNMSRLELTQTRAQLAKAKPPGTQIVRNSKVLTKDKFLTKSDRTRRTTRSIMRTNYLLLLLRPPLRQLPNSIH